MEDPTKEMVLQIGILATFWGQIKRFGVGFGSLTCGCTRSGDMLLDSSQLQTGFFTRRNPCKDWKQLHKRRHHTTTSSDSSTLDGQKYLVCYFGSGMADATLYKLLSAAKVHVDTIENFYKRMKMDIDIPARVTGVKQFNILRVTELVGGWADRFV
eukprot:705177-Amphidinium_carterae.1